MTATTEKLANALAAVPGVPPAMVEAARDGQYDDYLSPLTFPLLQLRDDLLALAKAPPTPAASRPLLRQLAERVAVGDFDATREEAQAWAQSDEGRAAFRELLGEEHPGWPG